MIGDISVSFIIHILINISQLLKQSEMKPQEWTKACLFLSVFMINSGWFWKVKVTISGDPDTELVLCIYPSQVVM